MDIYLSLALGTLIFSGQVYARVGWGKAPDGTVMSPSSAHWKPPNATSRSDPLREVLDLDGKIDVIGNGTHLNQENWRSGCQFDFQVVSLLLTESNGVRSRHAQVVETPLIARKLLPINQ